MAPSDRARGVVAGRFDVGRKKEHAGGFRAFIPAYDALK
jgi:hypothetical protein